MSTSSLSNGNGVILNARTNFDDYYEYGSEIGKGRYATVKMCFCKETQKCYAAKIIKNYRTKNSKMNLNIIENEITALTIAGSHSSIVNLYEVFYQKGETILILEYATEKDLHIYLDLEGAFEEEKACHIIYQLLKAIEFLHSQQVLHLDIKPENVLLMYPLLPKANEQDLSSNSNGDNNNNTNKPPNDLKNLNENIKVKLCDFSFSQIMTSEKPILGMMGTVAYSAPEVLQYDPLTKATDMWSLGVLTHVLVTEYTPFGNGTEENKQTETNILSCREKEFKCVEDYFDNISEECKDFIESLLKFKPKQRITVEQALEHNWFKVFNVADSCGIVKTKINENISLERVDIINETLIEKDSSKIITKTTETLIEIKDDKNNNSLSSIETFKLVQSTTNKQQSNTNLNEINNGAQPQTLNHSKCELKQENPKILNSKQGIADGSLSIIQTVTSISAANNSHSNLFSSDKENNAAIANSSTTTVSNVILATHLTTAIATNLATVTN